MYSARPLVGLEEARNRKVDLLEAASRCPVHALRLCRRVHDMPRNWQSKSACPGLSLLFSLSIERLWRVCPGSIPRPHKPGREGRRSRANVAVPIGGEWRTDFSRYWTAIFD